MNCWHCGTKLIWAGDHDISEEDEFYQLVTNLGCPKCKSHIDVYYPKDSEKDERQKH